MSSPDGVDKVPVDMPPPLHVWIKENYEQLGYESESELVDDAVAMLQEDRAEDLERVRERLSTE